MVEEWDLICNRKSGQTWIFAALLVGRVLGNIFGGHIGDYVGRKRALYPSQFGHCIFGALATACTAWQALAAFFFVIGFCFGVGETTSFVLTAEETTAKYRWIQVSCFQWCLQYPLVAMIAYFAGNWRMYLIVVNVVMGPVLVFYLMFLESPRFLIYIGDLDRAAKTLSYPAETKFPSPLSLFRPWKRAKLSVLLIVAMFTRSLIVGLFLQNHGENGPYGITNPILNISLYGIMRLWVPFFIVLLDRKFPKFGRRIVFFTFFAALQTVDVILLILSFVGKISTPWGAGFGLLGASLASSGAWMSIVILTVEAYPTAIRGIAFGWIESFNGVGNLVAPYFLLLGRYWPQLPGIILIVTFGAILAAGWFFLPETKLCEMTDRLGDVKDSSTFNENYEEDSDEIRL